MKALVTGSRSWLDAGAVAARLGQLPDGSLVIHGGAHGADALAQLYAERTRKVNTLVMRADWKRHGKRAGYLRNLAMLDLEPDLVIAFWDGRSPGTRHTIEQARKRGIPVEVIEQ